MLAHPSYQNQSLLFETRSIGECDLFVALGTDAPQLLEYLLAHYAPDFGIRLNLCVMTRDTIRLACHDIEGRRSAFLAVVHSQFVKALNLQLGRTGTMIQPGSGPPQILLDTEGELEALLEAATAPSLDIVRHSRGWVGTLFTPEDAGIPRTVKRPDCLNPRLYPDEVTYVVAAPKFLEDDDIDLVRARFKRRRAKAEKGIDRQNKAEGTRRLGPVHARRASKRSSARQRRPRHAPFRAKDPSLVEAAWKTLRAFRACYHECLNALRARDVGIVWPAGTNFHHYVNGFDREPGGPSLPR